MGFTAVLRKNHDFVKQVPDLLYASAMPTVKLYANLRKLAGTKELSTAGGTLGEVLNELWKQSPSLVDAILEEGAPRPHVVVTVNGHHAVDLNAPVTEQDVIAIFPPIAGGNPLTPDPSTTSWHTSHRERGVQGE